jgi:nicotinate-nucleotide pyrophosphorylase (carboxylating)
MGMVLKKMKGELVEVEVETEKEALAVLSAFRKYNTDNYLALMFDNFSPAFLLSVLSDLGNLYGLSSVIFEASGGIDKSNIGQWSKTGVDLISIGGLTHSPSAVNISLEL